MKRQRQQRKLARRRHRAAGDKGYAKRRTKGKYKVEIKGIYSSRVLELIRSE